MSPSAFRALPESDQDEMIAYVTEICRDCGNLKSVCSDPERPFYPQRRMCYATATREVTARRLVDKYGHPEGVEVHPTDGMGIWASPEDLTPDDDFLGDRPPVS